MTDLRHVELARSAEIMIRTCLGCKPGEQVLVITDTLQSRRIGEALMAAAYSAGTIPTLHVMLPRQYSGEEPPRPLAEAMKVADAILAVPVKSITYSRAVAQARQAGARVLAAPAITEEMMARSVPVDYEEMSRRSWDLLQRIRKASKARLVTPAGTDLTMAITGEREGFTVDGLCLKPGEIDWVPAGSSHISPLEGTAEGTLVVDGSLVPFGLLAEPVRMRVEKGFVVQIEGGRVGTDYRRFLEELDDPNVFNIAEIGLGVNPAAKLVGAPIEDERIEGGIIIGIGQSTLHGGVVKAKTHTDAIVLNPTLYLDGEPLIKGGKLGGRT